MVLEGKTPDGVAINRPSSVTVDQHGDIYITDWTNNRVLVYDSNGRYVWRFLGDATLSRVARDYMMTNAYANRLREMANLEEEKYFRSPTSVRVDNQFRICVADHSSYRLQVYQKESVELDENSIAPPMRNHSLTTV
jgi:outer membrane protein assembly factor BamB